MERSIEKMDEWLTEGLSKIFDFQVPEDLIGYILSIENETDLQEYMRTLLDFGNPHHKSFFQELCKRKFPGKGSIKQDKKKKGKVQEVAEVAPAVDVDTKTKKKTKFVNLYSQEGKNAQVVLLKGRHRCDCQASKHELVNNCLRCGRVVCKQEGSGPCLFCGNLVCTPEEQVQLNANTKASAKLRTSLLESRPAGWEDAVSHRNRLLEYDRTSERRTHVTDDDSDYFNTNSVWLNSTERQKLQQYQQDLHEKKHASRLNKKMTFDFAGRQIVEDTTIEHEVDEEQIRRMTGGPPQRPASPSALEMFGGHRDRDVAPGVNAPLLQFAPTRPQHVTYAHSGRADTTPRVQDVELQEMSDSGRCMSMHQPWASLLVEGIKMHEGRTWYTSHRGRLWIASTAKPPERDVISALENQYRVLYPEKQLKFPSFYPTGCLLGCVNVDDCLSQEEYQKKYPDGESDSPYVFICSNPTSLKLRFPIKGQHKIYALDKTIHQAAIKCIQKMSKVPTEEVSAG